MTDCYVEFSILLKQRLRVLQYDLYQYRTDECSISLNSQCREALKQFAFAPYIFKYGDIYFYQLIIMMSLVLGTSNQLLPNFRVRIHTTGRWKVKIFLHLKTVHWSFLINTSFHRLHKDGLLSWTYGVERWSRSDELQDDFMSALL